MPEGRRDSGDYSLDWWQAGIDNAEAGNYQDALVCFERCLKSDPTLLDAHFMKAACLVELARFEEANLAIEDHLDRETEVAPIWSLKATVHAALNELDTAVAACEVAIEISESREPKYLIQQAIFLFDLGRETEALENYDRVLQLAPEDSLAWMNKGVCLSRLGRMEEALTCYAQSLSIEPESVLTWKNIEVALRKLQRFKEMVLACEIGLEYDPDHKDLWGDRAFALLRLRKYDEALQSVTRALELNPGRASYWGWRACALSGLGQYSDALAAAVRGLEIDPDDAYLWKEKGLSLLHLSRHADANACFAVVDDLLNLERERA